MNLLDEVRRALKAFDPAKHPRDPEGTKTGGQFTAKPVPAGVYRRTPRLAGQPKRAGQAVPVKTKTLYHVTTRDAAESILKDGFDLLRVKPRWANDYAVSFSTGLKPAVKYFMRLDAKGRPDPSSFGDRVVLRAKVKGHFHDRNLDGAPNASTPQGYRQSMLREGWDAADIGGTQYVYNLDAIYEISAVDPTEYR